MQGRHGPQSRLLWLRSSYHRQCDPVCQPGAGQAGQKVVIRNKMGVRVAETVELSYINIARSPIVDLRAIKNASEIDGLALVRCLEWLEEQVNRGVKPSENLDTD